MAPVVCFEDGGEMELPLVRVTPDGKSFCAAQGEAAARQTKYPDVCGSIDELKKIIADYPKAGTTDPASLLALIDDACHMLGRMQRRREHYQKFVEAVASVVEKLKGVRGPDTRDAFEKAEALRAALLRPPEEIARRREEVIALAEGIRKVAGAMEQALYKYRDLAIELNELYAEVKGARKWAKKKQ